MTLTLHPQARQRLVSVIADALPVVEVENNAALSWRSYLPFIDIDGVLPQNASSIGLIGEFSDRPLMHFLTEAISRELRVRAWEKDATPVFLPSIPEFADPHATAERLVHEFESLPWGYELLIKTPLDVTYSDLLGTELALGDGLTLRVGDDVFTSSRELPAGDWFESVTRRSVPKNWSPDRFYLRAQVKGFIGRTSSRQAVAGFIGRTKSLAGFLLALDLYKIERRSFGSYNFSAILLYRRTEQLGLQEPGWLADEDAYVYQSLVEFERAGLTSDEVETRRSGVLLLKPSLQAPDGRLANAARWYFDSQTGENELLSFVQAMIVLEILFGDKATSDLVGVGRLIANRCAYLVGTTVTERETIISDITRLYATRSAIVHRGQDHLSAAERRDYSRLLQLCRVSIRREAVVAYRGARTVV